MSSASQAQLSSLSLIVADLQKVIDGTPRRGSTLSHRGSSAKTKALSAATKEEALLDPVQVGDLITISDTDADTAGLLCGARAELQLGVQSQGARAAFNYNDYAFRV